MATGIAYEKRIGQKFNMLTIVKITGKEFAGKRTKIRCLVRCDCGNEKDVRIEGIVNGQQYSCGCNRRKSNNCASRKMYNNYKNGAIYRGYYFDLTEPEFIDISSRDCHYCGSSPQREYEQYGDIFVLNGIDRKDNTLGYTVDNSLPCCTICNRAKGILEYKDFIAWINTVKRHAVKE